MFMKVTGIVIPTEWDERHQITGVSIQGNDEIEYAVSGGLPSEAFEQICRKRIRAEGVVQGETSTRTISLIRYEILPVQPEISEIVTDPKSLAASNKKKRMRARPASDSG